METPAELPFIWVVCLSHDQGPVKPPGRTRAPQGPRAMGEGPRNVAAHFVFNTVPALPGTRGKQRVELAIVSCPVGPGRIAIEASDQCRPFC